MKTTTFVFLVAAVFAVAGNMALADGRDRRDGDLHRGDHGEWRLGERTRDGYAIYRRSGRGWYRVPGSGIDIADGWVLGSKRESGGYAIYRWNGRGWDQAPGGAVRIGGSYGQPWVVNNRGQRFSWNGYDWQADYTHRDARRDRGRDFDRRRGYQRGYEQGRAAERRDRRLRWFDPYRHGNESRYRRNSRW